MNFSKTCPILGQEWTAELTVGSARRLKDIAGVTLDELVPPAPTNGKAAKDDSLAPLAAFLGNPFKVFDAFYALIKPTADQRGITKEQIEDGIGEKEAEAMALALLRAVHDFFRNDPMRQSLLRRIASDFTKAMGMVGAKIDERMEKADILGTLAKELDALDEKPATSAAWNIGDPQNQLLPSVSVSLVT